MKICAKCGGDPKPLDDFCVDRSTPDGRTRRCKKCLSLYSKGWRAANPDRWDKLHPERRREINRKAQLSLYGLSTGDYEKLVVAQGGKCAACRQPPSGKGADRRLQVDHCHESGDVRGLLCGRCNRALGLLRDDPSVVDALASYLRQNRVSPLA